MSLIDDLMTALEAEEDLVALLTGGIYSGQEFKEIKRQDPAAAFDQDMKILPCALVKLGTELGSGPYLRSVQTPFTIYFYQLTGYDVISQAVDMAYDVLNEQQIGEKVWNIDFDNILYDQRDPALDCSLMTLRMRAVRMR